VAGTGRSVDGETYGPLKVACENQVRDGMGDRAVIARAGFLVGPHDNVPRLPYWLRRVARGGRILAPGAPDRLAQLIDARDMAEFVLRLAESREAGTFNVTGMPDQLTLGATLDTCRDVTGSEGEFAWASDDTLQREKVPLFDGLPYWVPEPWQSFMRTPVDRAVAAGYTARPIADTVRDAWAVLQQPDEEPPHRTSLAGLEIVCGIAPRMEAEILERRV
jgi:2'-hydroxyisoflavone reductase